MDDFLTLRRDLGVAHPLGTPESIASYLFSVMSEPGYTGVIMNERGRIVYAFERKPGQWHYLAIGIDEGFFEGRIHTAFPVHPDPAHPQSTEQQFYEECKEFFEHHPSLVNKI